jgi:hypothetical protein
VVLTVSPELMDLMELKVEYPPSYAWKDPSPSDLCKTCRDRMPDRFCSVSRTSWEPVSLKICNVLTESQCQGKNFVLKTEQASRPDPAARGLLPVRGGGARHIRAIEPAKLGAADRGDRRTGRFRLQKVKKSSNCRRPFCRFSVNPLVINSDLP